MNKFIINNTTDLDMYTVLEYIQKITMATTTMEEIKNMKIGEWHAVVFKSKVAIQYTKNKNSINFTIVDKSKGNN